ncbi:hypothetical protein [Streptomyces lydicus]|uniref:hypothetical protein n=1 Tax=Streptomyces lydicus TaxID=47763 RepID=UPI0010128478|nr:hypothetical protein [Streptomyces lydicus]MCZ1012032.1 hypothetical protein [Streptomyces lydicus]
MDDSPTPGAAGPLLAALASLGHVATVEDLGGAALVVLVRLPAGHQIVIARTDADGFDTPVTGPVADHGRWTGQLTDAGGCPYDLFLGESEDESPIPPTFDADTAGIAAETADWARFAADHLTT